MKFRAVIFDLFGTCVPFDGEKNTKVLKEIAALIGVPWEPFNQMWTIDTFDQRHVGTFATLEDNFRFICEKLGYQVGEDTIQAAKVRRIAFTRELLMPFDGTISTLAELRKRGFKTGMITDCSCEVPLLWHQTPFPNYLDVTIFSCLVGRKKPDPYVYQLACERLAALPEQCVYVGDGGSNELTTANDFGMHAILFREVGKKPTELWPEARKWKGPRISELREILAIVNRET